LNGPGPIGGDCELPGFSWFASVWALFFGIIFQSNIMNVEIGSPAARHFPGWNRFPARPALRREEGNGGVCVSLSFLDFGAAAVSRVF
jgi:hypothetical protein